MVSWYISPRSAIFHWFLGSNELPKYEKLCKLQGTLFALKLACRARKRLAGLTSTLFFSVLWTSTSEGFCCVQFFDTQLSNSSMASALSHAVRLYIYNFAAWMHECKLQVLSSVHRCSQIWIKQSHLKELKSLSDRKTLCRAQLFFALLHFFPSSLKVSLHLQRISIPPRARTS